MTIKRTTFGPDGFEASVEVREGPRPVYLRLVADDRVELNLRISASDAHTLSEQLRLAASHIRGME